MKKKNLVIAVITVLMMTAGCTAQGKNETTPAATAGTEVSGAETAGETETGEPDQAQSEKESVITGIISDIKSFICNNKHKALNVTDDSCNHRFLF